MRKAWIKRALVAVLIVVTVFCTAISVFGAASLNNPYWDLVEISILGVKNMDWKNDSKYDDSYFKYGQDLWNAHKKVIYKWIITAKRNVLITDEAVNRVVFAETHPAGWMHMNRSMLDMPHYVSNKANLLKNVAAHELGHTLGCGHNSSGTGGVMRSSLGGNETPIALTANDKDSYNAAYAKYK